MFPTNIVEKNKPRVLCVTQFLRRSNGFPDNQKLSNTPELLQSAYVSYHVPDKFVASLNTSLALILFLGTAVTNQNLIHEGIKSRLNSGNACYHSVQNLFVFSSAV
jgi:hypothetical protein